MSIFVRFGNWGHRQPSTLVRRSTIVIAVTSIALRDALWWVFAVPMLALCIPIGGGLLAFVQGARDMPGAIAAEMRNTRENWRRNWIGARRVWTSRKTTEVEKELGISGYYEDGSPY